MGARWGPLPRPRVPAREERGAGDPRPKLDNLHDLQHGQITMQVNNPRGIEEALLDCASLDGARFNARHEIRGKLGMLSPSSQRSY